MEVPQRYEKGFDEFTSLTNIYVINVKLTKNGLKLRKNIKPILISRINHDPGSSSSTSLGNRNITEYVGEKKTLKEASDYFFSYSEACDFYDKKLTEVQKIIKKNIDKLIIQFNSIEDEKINLRDKKLERIVNEN
jgi:hypothetical protein